MVAITVVVVLGLAELGLRALGFGDPVLYDSNAFYGYRPLPNQRLVPFVGPAIRTNNLGLRCDDDWDGDPRGKVLFLGDSVTFGGNVADDELFTTGAVRGLAGQRACNGAVNAWGVENVHGLVVESGFLPAETYVVVLIEDDFYRGLTRVQGQLVWLQKPTSALEQVLLNAMHVLDEQRRYRHWRWYAPEPVVDAVVDRAARDLAEVQARLSSEGRRVLVYVSPMRDQVVDGAPPDALVARTLERYGIAATYLAGRVRAAVSDPGERAALFHDNVHLSGRGHAVWADLIRRDLEPVLRPR